MNEIVFFLFKAFLIVIFLLLLVAGIMLVYKVLFGKKRTQNQADEEEKTTSEKIVYPYKLTKSIFSDKEKYFYRDVRPIADKLGLLVFTKMRIADLLYIPEGTQDYQRWLNKIKAKHIDFILTDTEYRIKLLVEIDDPTHNRTDRKARDEEVDEMFRQQGMQILHLRAWGKNYGAEELDTIIKTALESNLSAEHCGK